LRDSDEPLSCDLLGLAPDKDPNEQLDLEESGGSLNYDEPEDPNIAFNEPANDPLSSQQSSQQIVQKSAGFGQEWPPSPTGLCSPPKGMQIDSLTQLEKPQSPVKNPALQQDQDDLFTQQFTNLGLGSGPLALQQQKAEEEYWELERRKREAKGATGSVNLPPSNGNTYIGTIHNYTANNYFAMGAALGMGGNLPGQTPANLPVQTPSPSPAQTQASMLTNPIPY
jgi:hypothetical protein